MWYGRTVTAAGTPVPNRDIEAKSRGSGPVITYRLSQEEIAAKYGPPVKSNKPVGIVRRPELSSEEQRRRAKMRYAKREEEKSMSAETAAPKAPDKIEVLRRLAAGQKLSRIEDEFGLSRGALHYWLGKWNLKGVKGEQAQRLLDEMLIDRRAECTAEQPAATDQEQHADSPVSTGKIVQGLKNHELIERLRKELAKKTARISELEAEREQNRVEIERLKEANSLAVALAGQASEKHLAEIEKLKEERDALLQTVERAVSDGGRHEVSSTEAIEAATAGLAGGLAYHTGAAIQHLWRWQTVEDLRRARHHIDRLVESVVVGAG